MIDEYWFVTQELLFCGLTQAEQCSPLLFAMELQSDSAEERQAGFSHSGNQLISEEFLSNAPLHSAFQEASLLRTG